MTRTIPAILLGAGLAAILALPARAQMPTTAGGQAAGVPSPVVGDSQMKGKTRQAPPPALPGSRPAAEAAPTDRPPSDMPPTEALFDAINRGDLAAARDAISRGADLNGQNVLGLSPLDLAVDTGRNEITFLLLSMRGPSVAATASTRPGKGAPALAVKSTRVAEKKPVAPRVAAAPAPKRQQYAGTDPGTPVPQAGFLGFGGVAR